MYTHFSPFLKKIMLAALPLLLCLSNNTFAADVPEEDDALILLGKYVFFDKISSNKNESPNSRMGCVTCHDPATGGTGSVSGVNLHQVAITGANPHTVGNLKPPTNAYASLIPVFQDSGAGGECGGGAPPAGGFCGGNFWDGRAEGRGPNAADNPDGIAEAHFPNPAGSATKHIGCEVFQEGPGCDHLYTKYFGGTADQALNPMPNDVEQNIERQAVCEHVASSKYAELYYMAWGEEINCSDDDVAVSAPDADPSQEKEFDISFKRLMLAVCAWQASPDLNSFSSKRDIALREELACIDGPDSGDFIEYYDQAVCDAEDEDNWGKFPLVGFTDEENLGHDLFYNVRLPFGPPRPAPFPDLPVTQCAFCHGTIGQPADGTGLLERYTDDSYHNIGTPCNPEIPGIDCNDPKPTGMASHRGFGAPGFWKAPTLRNVDKRKGKGFIKAYAHNGWFKSMESIVHFYNTANVNGATAASFGIVQCTKDVVGHPGPYTEKEALANNCWPEAEFPGAAGFLVGNLGMDAEQEAAIVAYLRTLTDTHTPKAPPPYKPAKNK